jgi:hypothetical protein
MIGCHFKGDHMNESENRLGGIGSTVRFLLEGETGKGRIGVIHSMRESGIIVTGKNAKDKDTNYALKPSQIIRVYGAGEEPGKTT